MHLPGVAFALLSGLLITSTSAATAWQKRVFNATAPATPVNTFNFTNYTTSSDALEALAKALPNVTIAYRGELKYGITIARIWTAQRKIFPQAIVYPTTSEHVSTILQFYASVHTLWDSGFAIMGGGHADFGGAQSPSVVIDLREIDSTEILGNPSKDSTEYPVLKVGGGSESGEVYSALDGTGWAFLGPRAASIGVGGFLLGGGIAYQTGKYGVACDNLLGLEVVLITGEIVYANPYNEHKDLFWAATGGGWLGFGVVTQFYIEAYPDPGQVYIATIAWGEENVEDLFPKVASWWESNTDPDAFPALLYYLKDPDDLQAVNIPVSSRRFTVQINAMHFGGSWSKLNQSFGHFYEGAASVVLSELSLRSLDTYLLANYPYGYNRLFYGKSHTNSTTDFYRDTFAIYKETVNGLLARGEDPGHTFWVDEYVYPNWNGAGPAKDTDTAWPHSTSAHITLTSGEWSMNSSTEYLYARDRDYLMAYLRDFQNGLGEAAIYDYPNYIAPHSKTEEVWGVQNFQRLLQIKAKYDPECLFNRGRVPATDACIAKGAANTWLDQGSSY